MVFYSFEFFCYFVRNFLFRVEYERNSGLKFFPLFLGLFQPVFDRNNAGINFLKFLNFLLFFLEFSSSGWVWMEFGTKIFFLFFGLSHPVLVKNNAGKWYFIFLNIFAIFVEILFPGRSMNEIREKIFFFTLFPPISSRSSKKYCRKEVF